jgi:hypothetical protein
MFEKPNKGDVLNMLSAVSSNAHQVAAEERARVHRSFGGAAAELNSKLALYVAQAIDEVHIRWLKEAMSVLAGYLGKVDATPMEMTEWAKPELEGMATKLIGEVTSLNYPRFAKDTRARCKEIFQRRIEDALREFQLGRIDGKAIKIEGAASAAQQAALRAPAYVSQDRLEALRAIKNSQFDLSKLIRLCEELNSNYSAGNYYSVAMLVRAILDHVPPMFSATKFEGVRAQHGGASFKQQMDHLDQSSRKIADAFLHEHVRRREVLPTDTQVYSAPALDTLLGEVAVKLQ